MKRILLFPCLFLLTIVYAQQIKLISEVAVHPITKDARLHISAISKNDTSYTLDSVKLSILGVDSCHTLWYPAAGELFNAWQFLNLVYNDSAFFRSYLGKNYDRRHYLVHQDHPGARSSLVIPDSSQAPIKLLEISFQGKCAQRIYLESTQENPFNIFRDTTGQILTYCVENRGLFNPNCVVSFTYAEDDPRVTLKYNFSGWGVISDSILWDFGDGNTTSGTYRPSHTYAQPGIYEVCMTVIDTFGCVANRCQIITQDTPKCSVNNLRVKLQRDRGNRAYTVIAAGSLGDSIQIDMGDGSPAFTGLRNQSVFAHNYPAIDTYQVEVINYSNRYGGHLQCADTVYSEVIVPEPEVRICAQLGPGASQDTLFFEVVNLTKEKIPMTQFSRAIFLDSNCVNITGYSLPLLNNFGEFPPINPFFDISDTMISESRNGIQFDRLARFSHARDLTDQSRSDVWLFPDKDSSMLVTGLALVGMCPEHYYLPELQEYQFSNFVLYSILDSMGNRLGFEYALSEIGCSSLVNTESNLSSLPQLKVWPNPSKNLFLVELSNAPIREYSINVIDAVGKVVHSLYRPLQRGLVIRLFLGHLPEGLYHLEIQDSDHTLPVITKSIVINR